MIGEAFQVRVVGWKVTLPQKSPSVDLSVGLFINPAALIVRNREVPRFVEREFPSFLECGVLSRGFLRVHCGSCRMDRVVGFSGKTRGCAHRVADAVWPK